MIRLDLFSSLAREEYWFPFLAEVMEYLCESELRNEVKFGEFQIVYYDIKKIYSLQVVSDAKYNEALQISISIAISLRESFRES